MGGVSRGGGGGGGAAPPPPPPPGLPKNNQDRKNSENPGDQQAFFRYTFLGLTARGASGGTGGGLLSLAFSPVESQNR